MIESFAFPIYYSETEGGSNVIQVTVNDIVTEMVVDSGAQMSVMGENQYNMLKKRGLRVKLEPDSRCLRVYGNGRLQVIGVISCTVKCFGRSLQECFLVIPGDGRCLLASTAAKNLSVLQVGPQVNAVDCDLDTIMTQYPKVFSGLGKLSNYKLSLHVDTDVTPVAQKPRRIPFPLKGRVLKKLDELEDHVRTNVMGQPCSFCQQTEQCRHQNLCGHETCE